MSFCPAAPITPLILKSLWKALSSPPNPTAPRICSAIFFSNCYCAILTTFCLLRWLFLSASCQARFALSDKLQQGYSPCPHVSAEFLKADTFANLPLCPNQFSRSLPPFLALPCWLAIATHRFPFSNSFRLRLHLNLEALLQLKNTFDL